MSKESQCSECGKEIEPGKDPHSWCDKCDVTLCPVHLSRCAAKHLSHCEGRIGTLLEPDRWINLVMRTEDSE